MKISYYAWLINSSVNDSQTTSKTSLISLYQIVFMILCCFATQFFYS